MALADSFDKIVQSYFSVLTCETFTYKGRGYSPKSLIVSPLIFRGFTCPAHCGGCCPKFTLDYLPTEQQPYVLEGRNITFNGKVFTLFTDKQEENNAHHCRNLNKIDARCLVHGKQPFSCDFELIRTLSFKAPYASNRLTQKLYGRGWQFLKANGERGALCQMLPITYDSVAETIRKLTRLKEWTDYFELKTYLPDILLWANDSSRRYVQLYLSHT